MKINSINTISPNTKALNRNNCKPQGINFKGSSMGGGNANIIHELGKTGVGLISGSFAIAAAILSGLFLAHEQDKEMRNWSEKEVDDYMDHLIRTDCWFG